MKNRIAIITILIFIFFSCKKKDDSPVYNQGMDERVVKLKSNEDSFDAKLDSIEFIEFISTQKLQEVYDLICISKNSKQKIQLDSILKDQLQHFFIADDSLQIQSIFQDLDSLKVRYVNVVEINLLENDSLANDSIGKINYKAHFFNNKKKYILTRENSASFVLKKEPIKLKKEFKYYFSEISEKDTIRNGVTQ